MDQSKITVVDIGLGNLHSLLGCISRLAPQSEILLSDDLKDIDDTDCVVLPGDGAFGACVNAIDERPGLREALVSAASSKLFLGICVGMQVLFENSEEDPGSIGLGVFSGTVQRFPATKDAKIPLMGWLDVKVQDTANKLLDDIKEDSRFYFLHSYCVKSDAKHVVLTAEHTCKFVAAIAKEKLFATQFHPEKSSKLGVDLLAKFLKQL